MKSHKQKIVTIVGPTASGKSDLAVLLALKFNGEVISADSRQVYKGLDIGTGKITKTEMQSVRHYMLDIASPKRRYSVAQFKKSAEQVIGNIVAKNKIPIICGGTGFFIDSLLNDILLPDVLPNVELRKKLNKLTTQQLFIQLKKIDGTRAKNIDEKNRHRIIRALEIAKTLGKVPKLKKTKITKYDVLYIGTNLSQHVLHERINIRLKQRLKNGLIEEVKNLQKNGLSWKRLDELGLEYRYVSLYLKGVLSQPEMTSLLETKIQQYAKRQMTWFKKNKKIIWINPSQVSKISERVNQFLQLSP